MQIFPAIDLFGGKAVRLYKGNYFDMTVYNDNPPEIAFDFEAQGAKYIHIVDLEGAKTGGTPNLETVKTIINSTGLFAEIGGGIRDMKTAETYLNAGAGRVILGTAAVENESFLREAVSAFGEKIAVGVDLKDGFVAVKGWTEKSQYSAYDFCKKLQKIDVKTLIVTDISRDGAMKGTNTGLYKELKKRLSLQIIASGGVSDLTDIETLRDQGLYGAIIGKAYYTGAIDLREAIRCAGEDKRPDSSQLETI